MPTRTRTRVVAVTGLLFCLAPWLVFAQRRPLPPRPLIKREFDKFHGRTTVSPADAILLADNIMFNAHFDYEGTSQPKSIDSFRLLFIAPPSVWVGDDASALIYVLINDQQPSKHILAEYSSTFRLANTVNTVYSKSVSSADFRDIACATKVEMRVGVTEGALKSHDLAQLKAVYEASGGTCR